MCSSLNCAIDVMYQIVAAIDSISDGFSDAASLHPGFAIVEREWKLNVLRVCPEERIVHANLVEHDKEVISW